MPAVTTPRRRLLAAASVVGIAVSMAACTPREQEEGTGTTEVSEATVTETVEGSQEETSTAEEEDPTVAEVREKFANLAPDSLFDEFKSCSVSRKEYYECSGPDVGQFQFFDSDSKAASTAQLLGASRNAKVVEEDGDKIVGWISLADSAVLSVVDTKDGKVLQQLMQTDREDPKERLYSLGLAAPESEDASESSEASEPETTPETTESDS